MSQIQPVPRDLAGKWEHRGSQTAGRVTGMGTFTLCVDVGFILYWAIVWLNLLPDEQMFKDYANPLLQDWNLSFLPLDVMISATGFGALWLKRRGDARWCGLMLVSMTLTFCSGLQAIGFWTLRSDFDMAWWLPNLVLMLGPLYFVPKLLALKEEIQQ